MTCSLQRMGRYMPHFIAVLSSIVAVLLWAMGVAVGPAYVAFAFVTTVSCLVLWIAVLTEPFVPEPAVSAALSEAEPEVAPSQTEERQAA